MINVVCRRRDDARTPLSVLRRHCASEHFFFSTLRFMVRVAGSAVRIVEKESSRVRVNDKKCVSL